MIEHIPGQCVDCGCDAPTGHFPACTMLENTLVEDCDCVQALKKRLAQMRQLCRQLCDQPSSPTWDGESGWPIRDADRAAIIEDWIDTQLQKQGQAK